MTTGTDVATNNERMTIAQVIARMQPEIARALPKGMDADRVARLALTVVRQSDIEARKVGKPENSLANCTPESFAGALLTAAALGLEPGINGEAYLVPYKGECTLIVGYQGYAKLFWQHPLAKHLDAHAVHEHDDFEYGYGLAQYLRHKPARGNRGKITDYYAVAELSTGASAFVVLTVDEVKALRGGKVGPSGKIADPQHWMERKTALRQLIKLLPKSANLSVALAVDEQQGAALATRGVPAAIGAGEPFEPLPPTALAEPEPQQRVTAEEITGQHVDTETGEVTDDAPAQTRAARMISQKQRGTLFAFYHQLGIGDRDQRLADMAGFLGRDVVTSSDLTADEAKTLLDWLQMRIDGPGDDGGDQ